LIWVNGSGRLRVAANQADEVVVLDEKGRVVARPAYSLGQPSWARPSDFVG
jgi:hypothetical protein